MKKKRSYENPEVPGQIQDYPFFYSTSMINDYKMKPKSVGVVAVYNKDIGFGLISCLAENGSQIYGYWFIIVLVISSRHSMNIKAWSLLPEVTVPYYPYDNACTRITPAVPAKQILGEYSVRYTTGDSEDCPSYSIFNMDDQFLLKAFHFMHPDLFNTKLLRSYENPDKPGQLQDYYIVSSPRLISLLGTTPETVSVIVAYHKDVGHGIIQCPAKNGSEISEVYVMGYNYISRRTHKEINVIKEEVMKIANITQLPVVVCYGQS
ncbi:hypothetical protein CHUAL_000173 [Chamberlinius hualienensis]